MTYRIVPRTEIGLPAEVRSSSGRLRPRLSYEPYLTAHYTGVNVDYTARVTPEVVRHIQAIFSTTKPFEYNYVIGQEADDDIFEFAGKYQAAHSGGENSIAFGVLFLLGTYEPLTDLMIDKWRWLRDVLIADGSLRKSVLQVPHGDMPGASTSCPGLVRERWGELILPWTPTGVSDPIDIPEESDMSKPIAAIKMAGQPGAYLQWPGFKQWLPTAAARDFALDAYKLRLTEVPKTVFVAAGPVLGEGPKGADGFGVF